MKAFFDSLAEIKPIDTDNSEATIAARRPGTIVQIDHDSIIIQAMADDETSIGIDIYRLHKYLRPDHGLYVVLLPLVKPGDSVAQGGILAKAASIEQSRVSGDMIAAFSFENGEYITSEGQRLLKECRAKERNPAQKLQDNRFQIELQSLRSTLIGLHRDLRKRPFLSYPLSEKLTSLRNALRLRFAGEIAEERLNIVSFSSILNAGIVSTPGSSSVSTGENEEGSLSNLGRKKPQNNLDAYFDFEKVPESERSALIQKLKIEIARVTRPKWVGRLERGGELATLSAPLFLKRVHADYIGDDGSVENETIRAIDSDLMNAVEIYLAQRRSYAKQKNQPLDLKDAEGLIFILSRPKARRGNTTKQYNVK